MKSHKTGRILLTALLALVAVGFLLPTVLTVTNAFMTQEELTERYGAVFDSLGGSGYVSDGVRLRLIPRDFTIKQFFDVLLQSPTYLLKFWNSILLVVPIVLGQVMIASMAAYSLTRVRNRARTVVFFFYIVLMLMPYQVTLVPNYLVSKWLGLLGTRWSVIFPGVFAPFSVFLLARFMQRIPSVQIEAAQLDGAGEWRIFTRICLPQCRGILYSVMILVFIDYWNMVEQPLVLLSDAAQYPLSVYLSNINAQDVAIAFAAAVIYMIPPMLLFRHGEQHLVAGIAQTGSFAAGTDEKRRRRRWVPVTAGLFFAVLAALTIFAQPLMERVVPTVTFRNITAGSGDAIFAVPREALLSDENGSYILLVQQQDSSLGERWQVSRVAVAAVGMDEETFSIETDAELSFFDQVIVSWSALPRDGQYVRRAEESSSGKL